MQILFREADMSNFRHPRTHKERKADQDLLSEVDPDAAPVKARIRSGKSSKQLPNDRDDRMPAARKDRGRGKRWVRDDGKA